MTQKDFLGLEQLLESIDRRLSSIEKRQTDQDEKLSAIHIQTTKTNGKVIKLRGDVDTLQNSKKPLELPSIPVPVLYLLAVALVIVLIIIATTLRIDISGILS